MHAEVTNSLKQISSGSFSKIRQVRIKLLKSKITLNWIYSMVVTTSYYFLERVGEKIPQKRIIQKQERSL